MIRHRSLYPELESIPGEEPESDEKFRDRIEAVSCIQVKYLTGRELDAVGKIRGLIRGGFREKT